MTPTKHTPGPWTTEDNVSAGGIVHFAVVAREQTNDWMVCSITPQKLKREQDVANAKLIAAAPELLEVLENLLAVDNPDTLITANWSAEDWRNAKRQYNEAIKATIQKATQ